MPRITIYIPDSVGNGLAAHPNINKSKVCTEALLREITKAGRDAERTRIAKRGAGPAK